jgi:hypothetical protein
METIISGSLGSAGFGFPHPFQHIDGFFLPLIHPAHINGHSCELSKRLYEIDI